jgi:hypothetical protein
MDERILSVLVNIVANETSKQQAGFRNTTDDWEARSFQLMRRETHQYRRLTSNVQMIIGDFTEDTQSN